PAVPRAPHSFPTRRSSDLLSARLPGAAAAKLPRPQPDGAHRTVARSAPASLPARDAGRGRTTHRPFHGPERRADGQTVADLPPGDRKSTRLNSSHVKISYA